jgi:hypothetical protein
MKKNLLIYLTFIVLAVFLAGCEKDGEMITMLSNPVAPTLTTVPDLTLQRTSGNDVLEFVGTAVDPGFAASATYYLEACAAGTDFAEPVTVWSGTQSKSMKMTVSDLNGILLKKFPADASSSIDFRLRAVLVVDAGTGAPGTGTNPFSYKSAVKNANVTLYGLPRLNLVGSATPNGWDSPDQKMDYDPATGIWSITLNLVEGEIKFRLNDAWAWNMGYRPGGTDLTDLFHNGDNIKVTAGNYTISLTITQPNGPNEAGSCTVVKNN